MRADFNGHTGERNRGDVMSRHSFENKTQRERSNMDMAVVNLYFKKEKHRVTFMSGGKCTDIDYILYRRNNLRKNVDCKVRV